ncbi:MAG: MFS transporter [Chitinophagaceae bacterium]|nr:MAG: MFS transporter [Chitinophagaceae bacterium]
MLQLSLTMISDPSIPAWQYSAGFVVSLVFLALFIYSSKKPNPLIDLSVFKSATFINCSIIILIRSLALYGGLFFLPFLLQGLMGYSEIETGLLLLPNAVMMLLLRPYAGKLADQGIIRNPSIVGIVLITVSMAEFAFMDAESHIWIIILAMAIRGFGMSLLVSPVSTSLLNAINPGQTATATSINSLLQQVGGSVGIAISGILHTYISRYYLGLGRASEVAEHFALQDGFLISGIIIAFAIIPALKLPNRNKVAKLTADKLTALR